MIVRLDKLSEDKAVGKQLSAEDKAFLQRFGTYVPFGQQFTCTLPRLQYSIKYNLEHTAERKEVSKEARERADHIRRNKPASMNEMTILKNWVMFS